MVHSLFSGKALVPSGSIVRVVHGGFAKDVTCCKLVRTWRRIAVQRSSACMQVGLAIK